jgi:hypothetical protein
MGPGGVSALWRPLETPGARAAFTASRGREEDTKLIQAVADEVAVKLQSP